MKSNILFLSFILLNSISFSQTKTKSFVQDKIVYQYEELNEVKKPKALLVLFDGGAGIAARIPTETSLADSAVNYKIKTIGIDQSEFFISDSNYRRISTIILSVMYENSIEENLFIGGMSLGGFTTVRFSEMAVERKDTLVIPKAIFTVDPPLDHIAMYNYCIRELERECPNPDANQLGKGEAKWILDYYSRNFGDLQKDSSNYVTNSCYSASLSNGGNARYLMGIPVNMIHEIDLMWLVKERCRDLTDANVISSSKFINYLYNSGNENAILTLTQNKGFRSDGRRHPHSWSIAEPTVTLNWLMQYMKEN